MDHNSAVAVLESFIVGLLGMNVLILNVIYIFLFLGTEVEFFPPVRVLKDKIF